MDNQSLAHSRYNCTYHIVFIPKYRRKVMFGALRKEVGEILEKVCKMEGVIILKAATLPEHVHMYVSIPLKLSVSKAVGRIKGKSVLMIFDRHPEYRERNNRHFWQEDIIVKQSVMYATANPAIQQIYINGHF